MRPWAAVKEAIFTLLNLGSDNSANRDLQRVLARSGGRGDPFGVAAAQDARDVSFRCPLARHPLVGKRGLNL